MALWVSSAAVMVSDRKQAASWYREKLGLEVIDDDPEHWTTVGDPHRGGLIHLCETETGKKLTPRSTGNSGILLTTDGDFEEFCRGLRDRGVRFAEGPIRRPWGWVAKIADPDGNVLWLGPNEG